MRRLLLKLLAYVLITALVFIKFADWKIVHGNPMTSFWMLFILVFICIKVIPSFFMFFFKIFVFAVISIGTTYLLGAKYDMRLPFIPSKSSKGKTVQETPDKKENMFSGIPKEMTDDALFKVGDKLVKLYGIVFPKDNDECSDNKGNKKSCKEESKKSLLSKISEKEISCTPKGDGKGFQLATCTIDGEDIASYLIKNGLGFSDSENTNAYDSDEKEARKKGKGIWKKVKKNDFFKDLKKKWKNLF